MTTSKLTRAFSSTSVTPIKINSKTITERRNPLEYFLKPLSQSKKSTGILPEAIVTIKEIH
jgi:hypothetical protein